MAFTLQRGRGAHWPELFKEIIRNDNERDAILTKDHQDVTQADWKRLKELQVERREFRRGAEKALSWNKDKGSGA